MSETDEKTDNASPGLSAEDERALERLADRIRSVAEYPDRAVLYQDIEYLRSRLAAGTPKPAPPGEDNPTMAKTSLPDPIPLGWDPFLSPPPAPEEKP